MDIGRALIHDFFSRSNS